jgi:(p)ppGpp synthase/HD superfamily hydrolase
MRDSDEIVLPKLIDNARAFAMEAHKNQVRKYTGAPYFTHPERVAKAVQQYCSKEHTEQLPVIVAAAYLHDVVEDCDVSFDDIRNKFGQNVMELVAWLTNRSKGMKLRRSDRKKIDRSVIKCAPKEAKIIKLLDRIDNLGEMSTNDPEKQDVSFMELYAYESIDLAEAIGDVNHNLKIELLRKAIHLLDSRVIF